jgi:voltage-gated potassium channel
MTRVSNAGRTMVAAARTFFSEVGVRAAPRPLEDMALLAVIDRDRKGTVYELFILLISVLSIVNAVALALAWLAGLGGPAGEVVLAIDTMISPVFLLDFGYRLKTADSRREYFLDRFGWADLLSVIPILRVLGVVRVARVVRSYQLGPPGRLLAEVRAARALATFLVTVFLVIVVTELAGATIYFAESRSEASNIRSASDAIWWALVTITTVGYGDRFPVTGEGRAIGVFLLFAGIALFSVLTGFIANAFLAPRRRLRLAGRGSSDVRASIEAVRDLLAEQEERTATLQERLDELDGMLARAERDPAGEGTSPDRNPTTRSR